jgi:hypothetical protein
MQGTKSEKQMTKQIKKNKADVHGKCRAADILFNALDSRHETLEPGFGNGFIPCGVGVYSIPRHCVGIKPSPAVHHGDWAALRRYPRGPLDDSFVQGHHSLTTSLAV